MELNLITDIDYPGVHTYSVTSITRSGTTATVVTSVTNALETGMSVTIAGANQSQYNGTFVITVTGGTSFTYQVSGSPASPATGTITAKGGKTTVPGVVYLDGFFFVMTNEAVIHNSGLRDASTWDALDFITAEAEPGDGKALARSANYVVAFKEYSTEFFYNAANETGSPLSPVQNGFTLIGCASGDSVTTLDGTVFWVSQTRQKGRSVSMMVGTDISVISDSSISRILNRDTLTTVYSYGLKIAGHAFYVLTLVGSNITIVYDLISKAWSQWSSLVPRASVGVSSITTSNGVATVTTAAAHGLSDGDPVTLAGANETPYNGVFHASYVSSTVFTVNVEGTPATPATGTITCVGYNETYFKYSKYVTCGGRDLVLHESNGHLYELDEHTFEDGTSPIAVLIRTGKTDFENTIYKTIGKVEIVGDKIDSHAVIRWSDDDYDTYNNYRDVDLSTSRPILRRCGKFRRRSFDIRHVANTSLQLSALEIEVNGGN